MPNYRKKPVTIEARQLDGTNAANGRRERLWLSPDCIQAHQDVLDFGEAQR